MKPQFASGRHLQSRETHREVGADGIGNAILKSFSQSLRLVYRLNSFRRTTR
jgi:hypothetical protein